jgi:hypothetical protein
MTMQPHRMFVRTLLASLGVVVSLVLASGAFAATMPRANGNDFLLPNGKVYQLGANGVYHLIPDVATANDMGLNWGALLKVSHVGPIGARIPSVHSGVSGYVNGPAVCLYP